jgi:hypothetical protein
VSCATGQAPSPARLPYSRARLLGMTPGVQAAVEVAGQFGLTVEDPTLIQETNNTVVWLRPHSVIAKVGTHLGRGEAIVREHAIAVALAAMGAPVAYPLSEAGPVRHAATGYVVTLWHRLERAPEVQMSGGVVGRSLGKIHQAMADCGIELHNFRLDLERAQRALGDDRTMAALAPPDRSFLRAAFGDLLAALEEHTLSERPLHGEPHEGNRLLTPSGLRWIDFENACCGPVEWDLAFLSEDAVETFAGVDADLLALLRNLVSARVATWCWVQARFPEMRRHGAHHLTLLRDRWSSGSG